MNQRPGEMNKSSFPIRPNNNIYYEKGQVNFDGYCFDCCSSACSNYCRGKSERGKGAVNHSGANNSNPFETKLK